jgi:phosphohistidine phosphatase SixA
VDLYLVRHAKAEAGQDDFQRALTKGGRRVAEDVAGAVKRAGVSAQRIEHSPLVRARQTAEIFAVELDAPLAECNDLRPDQTVELVRERLMSEPAQSLMLVGHNPFMEWLAATLLAEAAEVPLLTFHTCSVAKLVSVASEPGWRYSCDWLLSPALVE